MKSELGLAQLAVEYVKVGNEDRFDAVEEGKIDLLCGAATATLGRMQKVGFSIPIFPSGIGALLHADSPARLQAVLEGREPPFRPAWRASLGQVLEKRILLAAAGTTAEAWLRERRQTLGVNAEIVTVPGDQEGIARVLERRCGRAVRRPCDPARRGGAQSVGEAIWSSSSASSPTSRSRSCSRVATRISGCSWIAP